MPDQGGGELRVGLITGQEEQERRLRELLEANGLSVVTGFQTGSIDIKAVRASLADALVILINGEAEQAIDELELLIEEVEVPLLFHEGAVPRDPGWGGRLRAKLERLVRRQSRLPPVEPVLKPVVGNATTAAATPAPLQIAASQERRRHRAEAVWVLGASLGGPQAVRAFLTALGGKPPSVGLVLAQHIGDAFVPLLAGQLQRMTGIPVAVAREGSPILTGQVTLVPVDRRFTLTDQGLIALTGEDIPGTYRPCIDDVMEQVVGYYKYNTCAVIFSGMGDDGHRGAGAVVRVGGTVFAQSADSCVISSMPDAVRRSTTVSESAPPEVLARRMLQWIADRNASAD
ncbi:MAG TPA: chemotaxis protein CheB [Thiohalobacter sp.]|nr:chemotaxis protein CheB [Thiohalobacter sp.]